MCLVAQLSHIFLAHFMIFYKKNPYIYILGFFQPTNAHLWVTCSKIQYKGYSFEANAKTTVLWLGLSCYSHHSKVDLFKVP